MEDAPENTRKQRRKATLKINYSYDTKDKRIPFIRLKGKYLSKYGFKVGNTIQVDVEPERIVITKLKGSS